MTKSSQAGKHRGKQAMHGKGGGALGINRKASKTNEADDRTMVKRQIGIAPRAEPSTRGAKRNSGGRK